MRRPKLPPTALLSLCVPLLAASACSDDSNTGQTDDVAGTESDTDTGEMQVNWVPALGIDIIEVEANQGTRVPIGGPGGAWVDGNQRNTHLISARDTLVRVHFTVAEGWQPHDVKGVLHIIKPGGEEVTQEQIINVVGDSSPTSLTRTFYYGLSASLGETEAGTRYQVELLEVDTTQDSSLPDLADVNPASGPEQIGYEDTPLQMKIVLVPVHYTGDGDRLPDLSDANVEKLINAFYEQNPVREIFHQIRPQPIEYSNFLNQLATVLPMLAAAKQNDGADANVYYHGLIDTGCMIEGCTNAGTVGIANGISGDKQSDSLSRVAVSIWHDVDFTISTAVHEVGHNQGFYHIECPGQNAAGTDPSYPYADGKIGNWGFGIRGYTFHNPTVSFDYMTYCDKTWVSDWRWSKAFTRIATLTSWDAGAPVPEGPDAGLIGTEVLVGALYPDGSEEWFVLDGGIEPEQIRPGEGVLFEVGGHTVQQPAVVRTLSDDRSEWVMVPMPEGVDLADVDALTHVRDGALRRKLEPSMIRANPGGPLKAR